LKGDKGGKREGGLNKGKERRKERLFAEPPRFSRREEKYRLVRWRMMKKGS